MRLKQAYTGEDYDGYQATKKIERSRTPTAGRGEEQEIRDHLSGGRDSGAFGLCRAANVCGLRAPLEQGAWSIRMKNQGELVIGRKVLIEEGVHFFQKTAALFALPEIAIGDVDL